MGWYVHLTKVQIYYIHLPFKKKNPVQHFQSKWKHENVLKMLAWAHMPSDIMSYAVFRHPKHHVKSIILSVREGKIWKNTNMIKNDKIQDFFMCKQMMRWNYMEWYNLYHILAPSNEGLIIKGSEIKLKTCCQIRHYRPQANFWPADSVENS